jgi:hypothetical protein
MNRSRFSLAVWAVFGSSLAAQDGEKPPVESPVDAAIRKGIEFLKGRNATHLKTFQTGSLKMQSAELVLWTYLHAFPDARETDPEFKELFDDMMKRPLEATYCVALQAMVLEELDRVKHQGRIYQCAEFLVDNQCVNGQWSYGSPTTHSVVSIPSEPDRRKSPEPPPGVGARPPKPAVRVRLKVEKKREGPHGGDNSCTQYAALGLRACYDAGIALPPKVVDRAIEWLRRSQKKSEGPAMRLELSEGKKRTGFSAEPRGWCYTVHDHLPGTDHRANGSMTAGAIGSLSIWLYIKDDDGGKLRRTWKQDRDVLEGLAWLSKNFSAAHNPGVQEDGKTENSQANRYYYLYALERAGALYGTDLMGPHDWYQEGAKAILEAQLPDGSWGDTWNTCFAILFLRRATRPFFIATPGAGKKP